MSLKSRGRNQRCRYNPSPDKFTSWEVFEWCWKKLLMLVTFLLSLVTASSLPNEIGKLIHHLYVIICICKLTMGNFKPFLWMNIISLYAGRDSERLKFYYDFYTKSYETIPTVGLWTLGSSWIHKINIVSLHFLT